MNEARLPPLAIILNAAGLLPLFGAALGATRSEAAGGLASAMALLTYGAVLLSFLGGVHWGFVLEGESGPAERGRLGLGVLPGLVGWAATLLGIIGEPVLGLAVLIAGFIATAIVESRAHLKDLVPRGYMVMRWVMTVATVAVLTTVLVLRTIGAHVLF